MRVSWATFVDDISALFGVALNAGPTHLVIYDVPRGDAAVHAALEKRSAEMLRAGLIASCAVELAPRRLLAVDLDGAIWRRVTAGASDAGAAVVASLENLVAAYDYVFYGLGGQPWTFRHQLCLDAGARPYKGNRTASAMGGPARAEVDRQMRAASAALRARGRVCVSSHELQVEADDLIATVVAWAAEEGHRSTVYTVDKDFLQLLTLPGVTLQAGNDTVTPENAHRWLGSDERPIRPNQVVHYLALVGDPSDNVAGVPGIGGVGAWEILRRFATPLEAYEQRAAAAWAGAEKVRAKLVSGWADYQLALKLVTMRRDVALPFRSFEDLAVRRHG